MELNFNCVDTILVLNASAAFKTDSEKVFKEDEYLALVIIDGKQSFLEVAT